MANTDLRCEEQDRIDRAFMNTFHPLNLGPSPVTKRTVTSYLTTEEEH